MLLVDDRLKAAHDHAAAGRHDNAALLYESILDLSPGHPEALCGLIESRLAHGDMEAAQALMANATASSERDPGFLTLAARIALLNDDSRQAEQLTERALALDPLHVQAALLKAEFLAATGELAEVEDLLNGIRARKSDPDLLLGIARLYFAHGLLGPALVNVQEGLDLAPDNAALNALAGRILTALGDHGKAAPFLETAHLQFPANPDHLIALANNAAATGQLTEALRYAERARTLFPDLMPAWLCYIKVKANRGEATDALRAFAPVAKSAKDRTDAILTLGTAYALAGEPDKTLQLLEPLLAETAQLKPPEKARLFGVLRDAYLSTGQIDKVPDLAGPSLHPGDGDLNRTLETAAMVIDPDLGNLEFMVLARFLGATGRGLSTPVAGSSAISGLPRLFGYDTYLPNDAPGSTETLPEISGGFPVSQLLGLPAQVRGGLTGKVPYLPVREDLRERWLDALAEFPRPWIGLAWNETAPGLTLEPLLSALPMLPGTLVSTVWDHSRTQLSGRNGIIDAGRHIRQLEDLAALLSVLDLVIAPDGMVLHAAGAAGTPGLALIAHVPPWYWYAEDGRSLWYPSLEVIRAPHSGHWAMLLPDMAEQIGTSLRNRLDPTGLPES
ncbi:tetratricopeptide repeat protein [Roseibium sp. Sym1]|uniref:tetratricopeptide repeat protein n=1 Tax=Roseibium sp. Sym1 TaxID=3016006 RepID=UPI0022B4C047|nr:tetratricopeptide repeat protein [Roseibium sp. Sym1]